MDSCRNRARDESGEGVYLSIAWALVSVVLEWMLMFMIFVDASFAYLVTRFARRYHLQIPCLLCSRLDHFLGNEKADFYWDLLCHRHKSNISSLVLCQLHNNLVDVRRTCESCLFSFAKPDPETYRILFGKAKNGLVQDASSDEDITSMKKCSCCNEQWISRTCIQKLFRRHNRDETRKITEESSQLGQMQNEDDIDSLPHVEYSQIKVTSDTESEGPFSDNESGSVLIREMETSGQDSVTEKLIHLDLAPPIKISHHGVESEVPIGHGLEELKWQQDDHNDCVSEPSKLVSFPVSHPSPNPNGTNYVESKETNATTTSTTEFEKEVNVDCREASNRGSESAGTTELCKEVNTEYRVNEINTDMKYIRPDTSSQMTESLDLGDAYKLALGTRGRQLSGRLLEQQRSMSDSTRASEDLKLLLSQMSAARGIDLPLNEMSPRVSTNGEDFKPIDASGAIGMQIFQRRISLERNESNLSLDGSTVSEVEGESEVDRLKRQVEHDKKMLCSLYKELEEERNASAIAANQAMAMITRLQEEKASFNMEALQCLRMMEEQAEYDSEALQKANEMLVEKDKQIQDFEFAIALYRNPFGRCEEDELREQDNMTEESNSDTNKHDIVKRIDGISLSRFEDEKQYILECLRKLEEKLFMFTKLEVLDNNFVGVSQENGGTATSRLRIGTVMQKESPKDLLCGDQDFQLENEGYDKLRSSQHVGEDVELTALKRELSVMNDRLGALEAELNVIECSINALKKGSEGYEFIREIAVRLQELHSAHILKRSEDQT